MNKEECLKAKEILRMANDYPTSEYNDSHLINDAINLFENLIEEYFDNPPLKFEELEVGKVYWDKKYNQWCLIIMVCKYPHTKYFDGTISDAKFEENRFYRKQVEE